MSLVLGKIHYWLFNKILWFEGLERDIINLAETRGLNIQKLKDEINLKYGENIYNKNLEDIIDKSNIHGWLQGKINSSEGRMAAWTKVILNNNKEDISDIKKIYIQQGINATKEAKSKLSNVTAEDIFNSMNDYILDGMPCDRVNEIIISDKENVQWERIVCVHKEIWEKESISVEIFYNLRSEWIKAFVTEMNSNYEYVQLNKNLQEIRKIL